MLITLALRNVFRQHRRTGMTLAAIVFGVAGLILAGGFVQDIFIQLGETIIHSQTGHIQVFRRDFLERGTRNPEKYLIDKPVEIAGRLKALAQVDSVGTRLSFSGLVNNGRRALPIIGEGIEADSETRLGNYLKTTAGRSLTGADSNGVMVGEGVSLSLGLKPGDRVTLVANTVDGTLNTLDLELIGVFQSFSKEFDAHAVRIPLSAAQELLATAGANLLVVGLQRTEDTDTALAEVSAGLDSDRFEARSWRQLSDFYDKTVQLYDRQFGVLQVIILLMVLLSVGNSVTMTTFERQSEFGTLQALGSRPRDVFKLLLLESAILGLIGAALGVLVGIAAAKIISAIGLPMPPPPNSNLGYTAYIRIVPSSVATAFGIGLVATMLAAVFPAWRTVNTPVVDALRQSV